LVVFFYIGGIVDHHCLEVIGRLVDIGGIVDHHCLEVIGRLLILVDLFIITV
jgi:ethanolamine utilization protein EutA (predicted chaperonin)